MTQTSTDSEWAQNGTSFSPRSRADKVKLLPGGVYQFVPTFGGWFLDRTNNEFEFPFKVYSASEAIIRRITTYWKTNGGNLGILMNGLRGAGKTMTAQLLANYLIKNDNLPVLVVKEPVPLQSIFDTVKQDIMVVFDEFEKTHDKENQQKLLSTIDGMSRSSFNRLCVFTTNNPAIDENFKDRPSRIHYSFEFQRVADEIIEGLIDDSLPEDLHHLKTDIFEFLHSRYICTIDIVKAVIAEVRTFRESPLAFEGILNISKGEPPAFTISIVDPETNRVINTVCHYFKPDVGQASLLSGGKRAVQDFTNRGHSQSVHYRSHEGDVILNLLEKCPEEKMWLAEIALPKSKTFWDKYDMLYDRGVSFFMDNRPKDWKLPFTPEAVKNSHENLEKLQEFFDKSVDNGTIYGTEDNAVFKIVIEPNRSITVPTRWQVTGHLGDD